MKRIIIALVSIWVISSSEVVTAKGNEDTIKIVSPPEIILKGEKFIKGRLHQGPYYLGKVSDIEVDEKGDIWVLDNEFNTIKEFGREGDFLREIPLEKQEIEKGRCIPLRTFAIDRRGNLYVLTSDSLSKIDIFNKEGKHLQKFYLNFSPHDIGVDSKGLIYVSYLIFFNGRLISIYTPDGKYITSFGKPISKGNYNEQIAHNRISFCIDRNDNLWIAFWGFPVIRKYNSDHKLVEERTIATKEMRRCERITQNRKEKMEQKEFQNVIMYSPYFHDIVAQKNGDIWTLTNNVGYHFGKGFILKEKLIFQDSEGNPALLNRIAIDNFGRLFGLTPFGGIFKFYLVKKIKGGEE